jgi:VPDSG-CTERM motif
MKSFVSINICPVGTYGIIKKQLFYWHSACFYNLRHMIIKTVPTTKLALLCAALVAALLMFANQASAVSIRDAHEFGFAKFGAPSRYSDGSTHVNQLIGIALRNDERSNGQYFPSDNSTRHVVLPDHMNAGRSVGVITIPSIGGVPIPGSGTGRVPDGGITAMLLGTALGALGIARRYIRNQ